MEDTNKKMFRLRKEAMDHYPLCSAAQNPQRQRTDLAEAFVDLFTKGDDKDKIRAVDFLLEAIERRTKEELKKISG